MKSYTKHTYDGETYKYPIVSKETGNIYEVKIIPYGGYNERYSEGCIVSLHKKYFIFSHELYNKFFDNDDGKITISHWSSNDNVKTDYDYDLVNMAKLIITLYENKNKRQEIGNKKLKEDYLNFNEWNGEA